MEELTQCHISKSEGVSGDFRGKPGKRQVTVLSAEAWSIACEAIGLELPWTMRRANLLVSGLTFDETWVGKVIKIGQLQLEITKETDPCYRMDEALKAYRRH